MAVIKCKMCGGDLNVTEGLSVAECEYCGSRQTIPNADNEKKMALFTRASRLLRACEFDKAAGIFETIIVDFPEEAEAYWGLVLCKYGIEYVDDPATGKKVPTCHRSSFESVLDDTNFEQACEYNDAVARRVYRDEARQIEELRTRIIEVSGKEEPYDVFISYKETDDKGERTLDSVIAQDIYKELTSNGYRVFFSRISLEDKLGIEYEPYIFAALNSAKVMLAVGTDYENFDAVWVKNEWSRFLKLIEAGQKKVLIPVFKNMDAYDMPKEFAKLSAQDMGKVGAMQDLIRGIEKIISSKKETKIEEKHETVVIRETSGGPNVTALLKRGEMALQDGNWQDAQGYFDRVLDMDAECAEAYFGLFLVGERCSSAMEFIQLRKKAFQSCAVETLIACSEDKERISSIVNAYEIPDYLPAAKILDLLSYDRCYKSSVEQRKQQYQAVKSYLDSKKNLSRAENFATDKYRAEASQPRNEILSFALNLINEAKVEDEARIASVKEDYAQYLDEAEAKIIYLNAEAQKRRENDYVDACTAADKAVSIGDYRAVAGRFSAIDYYKDSAERAKACHAVADEMVAEEQKKAAEQRAEHMRKIAEEAEKQRIAKEDAKHNRQQKIKKIATIISVVVVLASVLAIVTLVVEAIGEYSIVREELFVRNQTTVSAGAEHTVAIKNDGTVVAVGSNSYGQSNVGSWSDIVSISTGAYHTVGLKSNGTVVAVGNNEDGMCGVSRWKDIVEISAGYRHTVGLKSDGTVVATGYNEFGQCNVSDWTNIVAISAGELHTVGLKSDGTVVAVGFDGYSQCKVLEWTDIVAVSGNYNHTVGLKRDGTVVAVGLNKYGQLNVSAWSDIIAISAGELHTVGLKSDGTVVAAGSSNSGKCDISDWRRIVAVGAHKNHTVGLESDGTVVAVGDNGYGQCDVSDWVDIKIPDNYPLTGEKLSIRSETTISAGYYVSVGVKSDGTLISSGSDIYGQKDLFYGQKNMYEWSDITAVSTGFGHTIGLKSDGTVVAVGNNEYGQCEVDGWNNIIAVSTGHFNTLGLRVDGTVTAVGNASAWGVDRWSDIVAISGGNLHSVGLKSDGTVVAVGDNGYGQCDVEKWQDIVAISAGAFYTVGLRADGTVIAVGDNNQGQCNVTIWKDIVSISAGTNHTVGLKSNGTVVATGSNFYGQINVTDWRDIVAVSAGSSHTLGLKADGRVVAVGENNDDGKCDVSEWRGIKTPDNYLSTTQEISIINEELFVSNQTTVCAGAEHTAAIKNDGTVVAVGSNRNGQCNINGWSDIVSIGTGTQHTVGLNSDGTVVAVGANFDGQCDVGDWTNIVAVSAGAYHTVGLKVDGTVVATGNNTTGRCDVSAWSDIVAISAGKGHTVGLKSDGTVVAVGYNGDGQCNVSAWNDIVAIGSGNYHTVGVKSDGTVVATGGTSFGICNIGHWSDIISVCAIERNTVGLKGNGKVVAVGQNVSGPFDVSDWRDIIFISAGAYNTVGRNEDTHHIVGLKSDGTVVAAGTNVYGECDVSDWTDLMLPKA